MRRDARNRQRGPKREVANTNDLGLLAHPEDKPLRLRLRSCILFTVHTMSCYIFSWRNTSGDTDPFSSFVKRAFRHLGQSSIPQLCFFPATQNCEGCADIGPTSLYIFLVVFRSCHGSVYLDFAENVLKHVCFEKQVYRQGCLGQLLTGRFEPSLREIHSAVVIFSRQLRMVTGVRTFPETILHEIGFWLAEVPRGGCCARCFLLLCHGRGGGERFYGRSRLPLSFCCRSTDTHSFAASFRFLSPSCRLRPWAIE